MAGKIWFGRKKYGWGWVPSSIEGWIVTILASVMILYFAFNIETDLINILYIILTAVVLVIITYIKGEKPRWQWGGK